VAPATGSWTDPDLMVITVVSWAVGLAFVAYHGSWPWRPGTTVARWPALERALDRRPWLRMTLALVPLVGTEVAALSAPFLRWTR
jgi:hypothetical protein